METAYDVVANGANLLDEVMPGWASKINTDTLAMDDCSHCILGQLYGSFIDGCLTLFSEDGYDYHNQSVDDYGFDFGYYYDDGPVTGYDELEDLWFSEIDRRIYYT